MVIIRAPKRLYLRPIHTSSLISLPHTRRPPHGLDRPSSGGDVAAGEDLVDQEETIDQILLHVVNKAEPHIGCMIPYVSDILKTDREPRRVPILQKGPKGLYSK